MDSTNSVIKGWDGVIQKMIEGWDGVIPKNHKAFHTPVALKLPRQGRATTQITYRFCLMSYGYTATRLQLHYTHLGSLISLAYIGACMHT